MPPMPEQIRPVAIDTYLHARCSRCRRQATIRLRDGAALSPDDTSAFLRKRGWAGNPMRCPGCQAHEARQRPDAPSQQELLRAWLDDMQWH